MKILQTNLAFKMGKLAYTNYEAFVLANENILELLWTNVKKTIVQAAKEGLISCEITCLYKDLHGKELDRAYHPITTWLLNRLHDSGFDAITSGTKSITIQWGYRYPIVLWHKTPQFKRILSIIGWVILLSVPVLLFKEQFKGELFKQWYAMLAFIGTLWMIIRPKTAMEPFKDSMLWRQTFDCAEQSTIGTVEAGTAEGLSQ